MKSLANSLACVRVSHPSHLSPYPHGYLQQPEGKFEPSICKYAVNNEAYE